jgi:hypothetical protein
MTDVWPMLRKQIATRRARLGLAPGEYLDADLWQRIRP